MDPTTFNLLMVAAFAVSYVAVSRRVDERLGGAVGTVLWALVAVGAFELTHTAGVVANNEGMPVVATETTAEPAIGLMAVTFALVMLVFTFAAVSGQLEPAENTRYGD